MHQITQIQDNAHFIKYLTCFVSDLHKQLPKQNKKDDLVSLLLTFVVFAYYFLQ